MTAETPAAPLVIFGFDAGDPRLLHQWAREGHLPALAAVMQRGGWAQTGGPELMLEHGVWHVMLSGISRARHGFYYFRQLKPRSYDLQMVHGCALGTSPFWTALRGRDKRVVVLDVPDVGLVSGLSGAQLVNWAVHRGWPPCDPAELPAAEPAGLLGEARHLTGLPPTILENSNATLEQDRQIHRDLLGQVEKKGALCRHLLQRERPAVFVAVFGESHTAGHQFWKYHSRAADAAGGDGMTHAIRDVYQAIDRQLGLLLQQLPASANVFVVSSVGMADHLPTGGLMEAFCRQLGYQAPPEAGPVSLKPMALIRRLVPEAWRVALSRRLPRHTREQLLAEQFRCGTNWRKTTAFALPSFYTGFVRVNLRGREPEGIVEPGAAYEALLERLEGDLRQLVDPQTGQPAVDRVVQARAFLGGTPPEVLPDLIVHWQSCAHFVSRVLHPRTELTQKKPEFFRNTDHSRHGFIAAAGPAVAKRGRMADVDALDLAPTFLALLNEPQPERMTGRAIALTADGDRTP